MCGRRTQSRRESRTNLAAISRQHNLIRGPPHRNDWKDPDLVVRDAEGKVFTVRYEAVNAICSTSSSKERRKVQGLQKQVEKLTAGLQKVSDELELRKSAPQVVGND